MKILIVICGLLALTPAFGQINTTENPVEVIPDQAHVEEKAQFPGGNTAMNNYFASSIKYPVSCYENKIEGKVFVEFVIDETGAIKGTRVKRKGNAELDAEAIRVVKAMPKWKPAKVASKPVRSVMILPVHFKLPADKSETEKKK